MLPTTKNPFYKLNIGKTTPKMYSATSLLIKYGKDGSAIHILRDLRESEAVLFATQNFLYLRPPFLFTTQATV